MHDIFHWKIYYEDEHHDIHSLNEFDADGTDHSFQEIDPLAIRVIELIPQEDHMPYPHVKIPDGAMALFFRRRMKHIQLTDEAPEEIASDTITCVGWKTATGVYTYLWYCDNGTMLMTDYDIG